ncbi:MAG: hypothetical protein LBQ38_07435 [Spirochaetaceae bacterium]|nr:hypothetical protein [Spirochaetaceae bacterium]
MLLDALLCLFISGAILLLVQGSLGMAGKMAARRTAAAMALIDERNGLTAGAGDETAQIDRRITGDD